MQKNRFDFHRRHFHVRGRVLTKYITHFGSARILKRYAIPRGEFPLYTPVQAETQNRIIIVALKHRKRC